jgi:hypothetical protein
MDNPSQVISGHKDGPGPSNTLPEILPSRGGRPRVDIDLGELEKLSGLQCTDEEIAAWFGVTTRTIENRRKEPEFLAVMERGKAKGRISVRRLQMKLLEEGNATMGVWLGKQILGQVDQITHSVGLQIAVLMPGVAPRIGESDQIVGIETTV